MERRGEASCEVMVRQAHKTRVAAACRPSLGGDCSGIFEDLKCYQHSMPTENEIP